jgi:uncharacterized repeat protein (TIGR03803 family)
MSVHVYSIDPKEVNPHLWGRNNRRHGTMITRQKEVLKMKTLRSLVVLAVAVAITLSLAVRVQAQAFTTLASFQTKQGATPMYGALVQALNGSLYGLTEIGGAHDDGSIFAISPEGKLTVLYSFCSKTNCADGEEPWSGLILGAGGNLYGTTFYGGAANIGGGTVFKVTPSGKVTTLYGFCALANCADGSNPAGALVQTSDGTLYSTTSTGGTGASGTIFSLSLSGKLRTLYSFCSQASCADGAFPESGLVLASNGYLYGTTYNGGDFGSGTVFAISPTGHFKTLYKFCQLANCVDGANPYSGLTQGPDGNLYGTTNAGGANGDGAIYRITPGGHFTLLHSFDATDTGFPVTAPVLANDGNLYGSTWAGGSEGAGSIYEITTAGSYSLLYSFCLPADCLDTPAAPLGALMQANNGIFYGTTEAGGAFGLGTVYSFSTGIESLVQTVK